MEQKEIRGIFFVLITGLMLALTIGFAKIGALSLRQSPLLFMGAVLGVIVYINEEQHDTAGWVFAAVFGLALLPIIYERVAFGLFGVLALLLTVMVAAVPVLIRIHRRLFSVQH